MLIYCCRGVFTAPLHSNERVADHRKHHSSIVARVRFRGSVFNESLPSNELFRLSGVMSQYYVLYIEVSNVDGTPARPVLGAALAFSPL
jgi:hypothetical protein